MPMQWLCLPWKNKNKKMSSIDFGFILFTAQYVHMSYVFFFLDWWYMIKMNTRYFHKPCGDNYNEYNQYYPKQIRFKCFIFYFLDLVMEDLTDTVPFSRNHWLSCSVPSSSRFALLLNRFFYFHRVGDFTITYFRNFRCCRICR